MKKTLATRYSSEALAGKSFDTIIIGSGMSGLTAACLLAKRGQRVIVLERHYMAGGFTHYFRRKGYEWDVGLHYIGDVNSNKSSSKKLFDYITDGKLKWSKMSDPYDTAIFPDKSYDFISGKENFLAAMLTHFPQEKKALLSYLDLIKKATKQGNTFYALRALPPMIGRSLGFFTDRKFHKYSDPTVIDVLSKLTDNKQLISVLTTQWGDYGLPPHEASFMIHAMVVNHYMRGGYFPIGGSKSIASTIIDVLRDNGSDVYVRADVDKVLVRKNKSYGVKLKNGDELYSKNVMSSAGIFNTFESFLNKEDVPLYEKKIKTPLSQLERSGSHVSLYLGLNKSTKDLKLSPGNQWIFPSYDHKKNIESFVSGNTSQFPVVYVSFPSAKDPLWDKEHPEKSTIDVIAFMPFSHLSKWHNTKWYKRGQDYLEFKEKITEELLKVTFKENPQIKDHIEVKELSTPLSTKHFTNYQEGEIYGLNHNPKRFRQSILRPHTPIKNLYLTGQDILSAGVSGALSSGLISSIAMTGKNLQKDIMSSQYK